MRDLKFQGIRPKHIPQKLGDGFGAIALNLDLYDGTLRGFNAPAPVARAVYADGSQADVVKTLYKAGATWVGWPEHTFVVPDTTAEQRFEEFVFVQDGRLYWQSEQRLLEGCAPVAMGTCAPVNEPSSFVVPCVPCPVPGEPPLGMQCVRDYGQGEECLENPPHQQFYRFTWVRQYPCCNGRMEESAPSPIHIVDVQQDDVVYLAPNEPAPEGVTSVRWYRGLVGSKGGIVWLFAGESAYPQGKFIDNLRPIQLGAPLTTEDHYPPPGCPLEGVAQFGDGKIIVWSGRHFYASHARAPHAFDIDRQTYSVPYHIVGAIGITSMLEEAETFETHLLTDGKPYRLRSDTKTDRVEVKEVQAWYPCINKASICDMRGRSGYASPYGYARFSGEGVEILTDAWMTEHEWVKQWPESAVFTFWHERLWMLHEHHPGFVLCLAPDDGARPRTLVTLTPRATAVFSRADVPLHIAGRTGRVLEWDRGQPMLWTWRSDTLVKADVWHPTTALVVQGDGWTWRDTGEEYLQFTEWLRVHPNLRPDSYFACNPQHRHLMQQWLYAACHQLTLFRNGRSVYSQHIRSPRPVRLPRISRAKEWTYELTGYGPVREVHLETMMPDLATQGAT